MISYWVFLSFIPLFHGNLLFRKQLIGYPVYGNIFSRDGSHRFLSLSEQNVLTLTDYNEGRIVWQKLYGPRLVANFEHDSIIGLLETIENHHHRFMVLDIENGNILFQEVIESTNDFTKISLVDNNYVMLAGNVILHFDVSTKTMSTQDVLKNTDHRIIDLYFTNSDATIYYDNGTNIMRSNGNIAMEAIKFDVHSENRSKYFVSKGSIIYLDESNGVCSSNANAYDSKSVQKIVLDNSFCQHSIKYIFDSYSVIVPRYSELLKHVLVLTNKGKAFLAKLSTPISNFTILEQKSIIAFVGNNDLPSVGELSIDEKFNVQVTYVSQTINGLVSCARHFYSKNKDRVIIVSVYADGRIYKYTDDNFELFQDAALSDIIAYSPVSLPPCDSSVVHWSADYASQYLSQSGLFNKFWTRLKHDIILIHKIIMSLNIISVEEYVKSLLKPNFFASSCKHEQPHLLMASRRGVFQLINVQNGSSVWRRTIQHFDSTRDAKILPIHKHNSAQLYNHYLAYAIDKESQLTIWVVNPYDGSDQLNNLLVTHHACDCLKRSGNVVKFPGMGHLFITDSGFVILRQSHQFVVLFTPKSFTANHKFYYFEPILNAPNSNTLRGYQVSYNDSSRNFDSTTMWIINFHDNATDLTITVDDKTYHVERDLWVVVNQTTLKKRLHEDSLLLSYFFSTNQTTYFYMGYIDGRTGTVLFQLTRRSRGNPARVAIFENILCAIFKNNNNISELLVVEGYKTNISSENKFLIQNYLLDVPQITGMTMTKTNLGLTHPYLVLSVEGFIIALPAIQFSARRTPNPSPAEVESGVMKYEPYINATDISRINLNNTVFDVRNLAIIPSHMESSTYICALSPSTLDCYLFSGTFHKPFDILNTNFSPTSMIYMQSLLFVLTIIIILYYNHKMIQENWED